MATDISATATSLRIITTSATTPKPNELSAPSTPLSLSFTTNFRLNSTETSMSSSVSSSSSMSMGSYYVSSPILRDFQEMTLSLTDEEIEDDHNLNPQTLKQKQKSLFVFCDDHTTANNINNITPFPITNNTNYDNHQCSFTSFSFDDETCFEDTANLTDDEDDDENPFLMGLEIDIPSISRKSSISEFKTIEEGQCHDMQYHMDRDTDIESCDDEEDDEYSNNYFVDDIDADECCDYYTFDEHHENQHENIIDRKFMMRKYKYIKNIGIGAFGIVDKVLHRKLNQYVAIKQSRSIGDEVLKQFRNEFNILQEFTDCEYIIDLIDYGRNVDANQICLGLEYMDIGSLKNIKTYNIDQIKYICKCILIALQALHSKLYVHNDIKPENILISSDGKVKLIDFGCTMQMKHENDLLTKSIGSIRYLSFEKRFMSPIQYNTKSDIYSFGITISEIFNGEHIRKKTLYDHYFDTSSPITKLKNNTDSQFTSFISKCIEQDPNKRWSATQLLNHPFLQNMENNVEFNMQRTE